MLVEHVKDVIVCAVVQLLYCRLLHMLSCKVGSIFLVALGENFIMNRLYSNYSWMPIVKWSRAHELVLELHTFGTVKRNWGELISSPLRWSCWVTAPAWMCESQILTTAISCYELGALLTWRAMSILNTDRTTPAIFDKFQSVELVHKLAGNGPLQNSMSFLEVSFHNLYGGTLNVVASMPGQEVTNILLELVVREMSMQEAHPQDCSCRTGHHAISLWRNWPYFFLHLRGPHSLS